MNGALPMILVESASDAGDEARGAMRFVGLPAGYEFSTLVADIVGVSSGTVGLSQATQDELRALEQDLHSRSLSHQLDPTVHVRPGWPTRWRN